MDVVHNSISLKAFERISFSLVLLFSRLEGEEGGGEGGGEDEEERGEDNDRRWAKEDKALWILEKSIV